MDPFVHLHVASAFSMRHGACHPEDLVLRAAELGMDSLAITDRDGVYGAVKFARACQRSGVRPIFGTDLALVEGGDPWSVVVRGAPHVDRADSTRTPVRGGSSVDPRHPRVTVLALDGAGWGRLCRLLSAAHRSGGRGSPTVTRALVAEHSPGLLVMLGPASDVGRAVAARRPDRAREALDRWRSVVPKGDLVVEVVNHRGEGDAGRAAAMVRLADEAGVTAVVSNAVRYLDRGGAVVVDVLDAIRRLVPVDGRHVDRRTAEGYLKSGKEMAEAMHDLVAHLGERRVRALLATTRSVAERCVVDPVRDLGVGGVRFPELAVATVGSEARGDISDGSPAAANAWLRQRCEAGIVRRGLRDSPALRDRLVDELSVIADLGYATYFLTVAEIVGIIKRKGIRCAARGSGAGSLVNYLLGISDVDPLRYGLLMERFLSPLRRALPDIDIDVESARRLEVYQAVFDRFGTERSACVSMMETYRARHAIRDVGAALGIPPGEVDAIAKAFPHVRANQVRSALRDLPELRNGLAAGAFEARMGAFLGIVEQLDGLPRHIAMHPCGLVISDATLLDRTPVEDSASRFPMSQFDKDDVEDLGLLKLDLLGIRMQSAIAHALQEVRRVDGAEVDIDAVPRDDPETFSLIRSTRTLGCFQIESPGQRELLGKFAPETFEDIIIDISLFRPGPVKSDMVNPFLEARQGWRMPAYLHPDLHPVLWETRGVVVFHEQVLRMVSVLTGCSLAEADEVRRDLGDPEGQERARVWFRPAAIARGYSPELVERSWEVLRAFGSFGFCKAHAAAFALPTYQSAWLKARHPAAFLAGVMTHDPGMYPKRLILDDARNFGITILGVDVNRSDEAYRVEKLPVAAPLPEPDEQGSGRPSAGPVGSGASPGQDWRDAGAGYGIRVALSDVKGITEEEVARVVTGRPYASLADFWLRAGVSRPVTERLVLAGAFDTVHGIGGAARRGGGLTRRDLLLQVGDLDAWSRSARRGVRGVRVGRSARSSPVAAEGGASDCVQLSLDLGDAPMDVRSSGLPEMTPVERVAAELDVLGLDTSAHVLSFDAELLAAIGVVRARALLEQRSRAEVLVAGVKVATQTPPVRSGRRVIFVTLDDATGPVDATFFEDVQPACAMTVFHSWQLVIRGVVRRTGPRGVSLRATGCWDLGVLRSAWDHGGEAALRSAMADPGPQAAQRPDTDPPRTRAVLVHPTGFRMSPYADIGPAGAPVSGAPRKLWHASPGSAGG